MVDFSEPLKKLVHEYGYKNCFNLELNDLNYNKELSKDEKISEIIKEIEYLEELIG